jgi:hypothetical protein
MAVTDAVEQLEALSPEARAAMGQHNYEHLLRYYTIPGLAGPQQNSSACSRSRPEHVRGIWPGA